MSSEVNTVLENSDDEQDRLKEYLDIGEGISSKRSYRDEESFEDIASNVGFGLHKENAGTEEASSNASQEEEEAKEKTPKVKDDNWYDEPTFSDQLTRYPDLCKFVGPRFKIFDLSSEEDVEKLNTFMERTLPTDAPGIIVDDTDKKFGENSENWKMLITYYEVKYRKLLHKGTK